MKETLETQVQSMGQEDRMEKEMATFTSIPGNIPWTGAWWATVHGVVQSQTQLSMHVRICLHTQTLFKISHADNYRPP